MGSWTHAGMHNLRSKKGQMSQSFVSIVTPVYNTADSLAECIDSVLAQTHTQWEYIIADNRSTDGTSDIAAEYSRRDSRIRHVRHEEFLAQVPNYNRAMASISDESRYCKVIQADDWMMPECLDAMATLADANPAVGLVGAYLLRGRRVGAQGLAFEEAVVSGRTACRRHLLHSMSVFGSPSTVMYRSDLVRARPRFYSEESLLEDTKVCYELLKESDFGFVHRVLTYVRVDNASITSAFESFNPYLLHELVLLHEYGSWALEPHECDRRARELGGRYWAYLGEALLSRRSKEFWDYHESGMKEMEIEWDWRRKLGCAGRAVANLAGNPASTLRRMRGKLAA